MDASQLSAELKPIYHGFSETFLRSLLRFQGDQRGATRAPKIDASRLILDLSQGRLNGENAEALQEGARRDGVQYDPQRPYVSFRDLTVASSGGGGYLVAVDVQDCVDILRPWSVMARAGIQIEDGLVGSQSVPKVTGKTTPAWLSTEGTQVSTSTPTLSQIALTPHQVGSVLQYSKQFSKQANAPKFAARELLRTVGMAVDQAVIAGSGSSGVPQGLVNTPGVQAMAGASLTGASASQMTQLSAEANATDEDIAYLSTPKVRRILQNRERASGNGMVWDADRVYNRPGYVSTDTPADYLLCGPWPTVYLGIWGRGLQLEIDPFNSTGFKSGLIQARVIVSCDVAILQPAAFVVANSVS